MTDLISLSEARAALEQEVSTIVSFESVPLADALGRRLAQDYEADTPWPATDRSAMDGYGVRAGAGGLAAETSLDVVGVCLAGHPYAGAVADGEAIRIMTGAVVPADIDAVVPVENTSGYVDVGASVTLAKPVARGANIRPVGSEVAMGDRLLTAGQWIDTAAVGALAVLGIDQVPVFRRPVVVILATGDEVVPIDSVPQPHQVRNSNAWALAAQVRACGGEPRLPGILGDTEQAIEAGLTAALQEADVVLTIGGVSKGTHDLVHGTLASLGVQRVFHGVKLKPGKPVYFGARLDHNGTGLELPCKTYVFGLPGNPASAFTCFDLFVRPVLGWLAGGARQPWESVQARVAGQPFRKNWRLQAVPASLRTDESGQLVAELGSSKPSGDPFGVCAHHAYALIPPDTEPAADLVVPVCFYSDSGWADSGR